MIINRFSDHAAFLCLTQTEYSLGFGLWVRENKQFNNLGFRKL